jgi:nucleoside-diphosphate-sugar epimerase
MNILVTGASGLIGSALVQSLQKKGNLIYCQSRYHHEEQAGVKWLKHDLVNDSWEDHSLPAIDVIYHLAGQTSTYVARQNPIADLSSNVLTLLNILEFFKKQAHPPFIVLAGTVTEVGLTDQLPINENFSDHPITFYDISKLTAELYLKQYVKDRYVNGCCLRLPNVFGRMQNGQMLDRGIIDKVYRRAIDGLNINLYGDGGYIRDYLFLDDVVSAFVLASENMERTNGRMFCLGSGRGIALKDAFMKVIDAATLITGTKVELVQVPPPVGLSAIEYRNAVIDASEFTKATGWLPKYSFDEAIIAAYHNVYSGK